MLKLLRKNLKKRKENLPSKMIIKENVLSSNGKDWYKVWAKIENKKDTQLNQGGV